jgi:hypothetical protein
MTYETARDELLKKRQIINQKIADKIIELRQELKTKFKIDDSTAPNFGSGTEAMDNNRLTLMQHHDLKRLLEKIRYLKN